MFSASDTHRHSVYTLTHRQITRI